MIFPESASAHRFLDGLSGIEIGGSAHNPFKIRGCLNVDYTDDMTTIFKKSEFELAGAPLPVDIVAAGDALPFADESMEYVLSSHVVEHFFDPIAAIEEWLRVLRPGGIIFMIVPHKERTFDVDKARTRLAELIMRHDGQRKLSLDVDPHGHHNIWITEDVVELVTYLGLGLLDVQDTDDKVGNGFTIVFHKAGKLDARAPVLDLGCGSNKRMGSVGIDRLPGAGIDVVCDVVREPLPFAPDSVSAVYSNALFQLIDDPIPVLREIVRVAKAGAAIEVFTPHCSSDESMLLGNRQRYSEATWLGILASDAFVGLDGNLQLCEIVLQVAPATILYLKARNLPLDFATTHLTNVVSRIGAIMTVNKPAVPRAFQYSRRIVEASE